MSPQGVTAFPDWAGSQATSPTSARPAASVPPPPSVIPPQASSNEEPLPLADPSPTLPAKVLRLTEPEHTGCNPPQQSHLRRN